jgi:hypothetical protein
MLSACKLENKQYNKSISTSKLSKISHLFQTFYSVLIIKHDIQLVKTGLTEAIGTPLDYNNNVSNNNFPLTTDLSISKNEKPAR